MTIPAQRVLEPVYNLSVNSFPLKCNNSCKGKRRKAKKKIVKSSNRSDLKPKSAFA